MGSRRRWWCAIIIMIVGLFFYFSPSRFHYIPVKPSSHAKKGKKKERKLTFTLPSNEQKRPHRQRLRALQVRGLGPKGLRRPQQPLVRRPPHLLRTLARHRLPRSLLPAQQRRGLRPGRLLQLHSPQGAERGAGPGARVGDQEVVEAEGEGRAERDEESEPGADEEAVLKGRTGLGVGGGLGRGWMWC